MRRYYGILLTGLVHVLAGCGGDEPPGMMECWEDGTCAAGDPCRDGADCPSGSCTDAICDASCEAHADCAEGTYCVSVMVDGSPRRHCSATCGDEEMLVEDDSAVYACVDGEAFMCRDFTQGTDCDVCGCPDGSYCINEVFDCGRGTPCQCRPEQPFGETCQVNQDCSSKNCSGTVVSESRSCQLAAGAPCDPNSSAPSCVWCVETEPGDFRCQQSCVRDSDCADGGHCLGDAESSELACWRDCHPESNPECGAGFTCTQISEEAFACLPE